MSTRITGNNPQTTQGPGLQGAQANSGAAAQGVAGKGAKDSAALAAAVTASAAGATGLMGMLDSSTSKGPAAQAANVQISTGAKGRAEAMQKAMTIARNTPDVREDKVADLKARIAAGTYKPDSGLIADGMLREAVKDHLSQSSK